MNARFEILRAKAAPAALSVAIAVAFGLGAPAQAQYSYPGTASSSGHSTTISPMRAGTRERADYANAPARHGPRNPSMQRGEACPPGSQCATPVPANGSGSGGPSGGYGARESYGATSTQSPHEANAIHPAADGGKASISPVRAGYGALNYGPSQTSNANFRNGVTSKSNGPNMNTSGQSTSFTGPNGQKVNMGDSQNVTGPNGQKQTIGGGPDLNHFGGGYGHQKGSGMNMGGNVSFSNGSGSMQQTGSAPGMASASGMNLNNGGTAGEESGSHIPNSSGQSGGHSDSNSHTGRDWAYDNLPGHGNFDHPTNGTDDNGNVWKDNVVWTGTDSNGTKWRNGNDVGGTVPTDAQRKDRNDTIADAKKNNGGEMPADMGATAGPGEIVSGTGQVVHPGQKKGQDTGGGQGQDSGSASGGGQNAQGQYIAPSGQDNVKKPKEAGVLKMNYNGKNGAIDPKLNGSNGGG